MERDRPATYAVVGEAPGLKLQLDSKDYSLLLKVSSQLVLLTSFMPGLTSPQASLQHSRGASFER